jgi:hypothetical protein
MTVFDQGVDYDFVNIANIDHADASIADRRPKAAMVQLVSRRPAARPHGPASTSSVSSAAKSPRFGRRSMP